LDIRRIQAIKEGDKVVGSRTRGKVVKNKVAAPFREAEFDILYGEGISREGDLIDLGVDKGLIEKSGTWMSYGTERMGQGRENSRVFLKENTGIRDKLEAALRKQLGLPIKMSASNGASPAEEPATTAKAAQADKPAPAAHAAAAGAGANAARPRPTR
jgi:recombination protein RecA